VLANTSHREMTCRFVDIDLNNVTFRLIYIDVFAFFKDDIHHRSLCPYLPNDLTQ